MKKKLTDKELEAYFYRETMRTKAFIIMLLGIFGLFIFALTLII